MDVYHKTWKSLGIGRSSRISLPEGVWCSSSLPRTPNDIPSLAARCCASYSALTYSFAAENASSRSVAAPPLSHTFLSQPSQPQISITIALDKFRSALQKFSYEALSLTLATLDRQDGAPPTRDIPSWLDMCSPDRSRRSYRDAG